MTLCTHPLAYLRHISEETVCTFNGGYVDHVDANPYIVLPQMSWSKSPLRDILTNINNLEDIVIILLFYVRQRLE